ncbi:MAG: GNAT family N-acetyltransferase [Saprospiraceae bacterium]|nr:GNAT family N-acetyltransferase [Saprospiraceae bacterium]
MEIELYTYDNQLANREQLEVFVARHPQGNFFQSPKFFDFIKNVKGYRPFQLIAKIEGKVVGSLLGVLQSNGGNVKSWLSRRLIVWGGPLLRGANENEGELALQKLLQAMKQYARGKAIFTEFRNFFDMKAHKSSFEAAGFEFRPHLNFLVKTEAEATVRKRLSNSKMRQIKSSLKLGATVEEAASEKEVIAFYEILEVLYQEKVKKPLPNIEFFLNFYRTPAICKFFVVKYQGEVVGGILCPIFENKVIYEWYVGGKDRVVKGLHPSVLATWAPIEYAVQNGYDHFDFMGAGKPNEHYGVREFKARFGGEEVGFGRFYMILDKSLYQIGQWGLKVYQKIM